LTTSGATHARGRAWLGNLALLGCSVALVLGGLELAARWQLSRPVRGKGVGGDAHMRFHPLLGWEKLPGAVDEYDRDDFHVVERINSRGLRDVERDYPARGAYRVLALGDSFVEGYTVELEETVTRQLEARLTRPGCPVEVVNGGTAGYGTDQEWLFFREEGRRYEPRLVLLFFFYNDVDSNLRTNYFGAPKPLVVAGSRGLQPANTPLHPRRARPPAEERAQGEPEPARGSALWEWIQRRTLRGAPRTYERLAAWGVWPPVRPTTAPPHYRVFFVPADVRVKTAWHRTEELLGALRDDVASSGGRAAQSGIGLRGSVGPRPGD
jgi:lysophospholipase L1-like esterase